MTAGFACRVAANRLTNTVTMDLMIDGPGAPDITLELEPARARELAQALLTAAEKAAGLVAEA